MDEREISQFTNGKKIKSSISEFYMNPSNSQASNRKSINN